MNQKLRKLSDDAIQHVTGGDNDYPTASPLLPCNYFSCADLTQCPHTEEEQRDYNCSGCTLHDKTIM